MNSAQSTPWFEFWRQALGWSEGVSVLWIAVVVIAIFFFFVFTPSGYLFSYLSRKFTADFQARVGPNRSGPIGLFQPAADFIKDLQKSPLRMPLDEWIPLILIHSVLFSAVISTPLSSAWIWVDTDAGIFVPVLLSLFAVIFVLFYSDRNKIKPEFSLTLALRLVAQSTSALLPAVVSMICVGARAGSFRWSDILSSQGFLPHHWAAFSSPFLFIALITFSISTAIVLALPPFSFEGGVDAPFSAHARIDFRLVRYLCYFLWATLITNLFLGGGALPESLYELWRSNSVAALLFFETVLVLIKSSVLLFLLLWISKSNPVSRVDQVTQFTWGKLLPASIVALVGVMITVAFFGRAGS